MFASDFPVAGLHSSFDEVFDSFKAITAEYTPDEWACFSHDSAQRIYRVGVSSSAD